MSFQERNAELVDLLKADLVSWDHLRLFGHQLGIRDILRGNKDDFFGDLLADEYDQTIVGAGSVALVDGLHGAAVRVTTGAVDGNASVLWLGANVNTHRTLGSPEGWVALTRFRISNTTNLRYHSGASNAGGTRRCFFGMDSVLSANWMIFLRTGACFNDYDTGVPYDTDWHEASFLVTADMAYLSLDGVEIGYTDTCMPPEVITPVNSIATSTNASRYYDLDYWEVIPRNL